jgi:hypothetical protein
MPSLPMKCHDFVHIQVDLLYCVATNSNKANIITLNPSRTNVMMGSTVGSRVRKIRGEQNAMYSGWWCNSK